MTILVTGAGGFVGLALTEELLRRGERVVALNDRPLPAAARATFAGLPGELVEIVGDVRDEAAVAAAFAAHGVSRVLHGAAITLGPAGRIAPAETVCDVNVLSTAILLDAARRHGVARFVYPSSSAVYGAAAFGAAPVTEDTEPAPTALYGFTKLASERLVRHARERGGLDTVRARITAVFGPWEHDTGVRETLSPPHQIAQAALRGDPVSLAAGGARDWTSSRDVARALALLLTAPRLPCDLYNLSLGETWHPELLCRALAERLPAFSWRLAAPGDTPGIAYNDDVSRRRVPVDGGRIARDLGFGFMSPQAAVADYVAWLAEAGSARL